MSKLSVYETEQENENAGSPTPQQQFETQGIDAVYAISLTLLVGI
jgi:hypothetical protein